MHTTRPKPRSRLWHAPVFLLVYQIAPVQARLDEIGKLQIALGFSGGRYEDLHFGCDGSVIRSAPVTYSVIGAQAEVWASRSVRLSAGGGVLRSSSDSLRVELMKGAFGSMLLAYEGKDIGFGGGVTIWPGRTTDYGEGWEPREFVQPSQVLPSVYVRLGKANKVHFRIDDNASSAPGSLPGYRFGVASGYAERRQARWFAGFVGQEKGAGIEAELGFPMGKRLEPVIHGGAGLARRTPGWNLGLGLRAKLGKARRP